MLGYFVFVCVCVCVFLCVIMNMCGCRMYVKEFYVKSLRLNNVCVKRGALKRLAKDKETHG